jgi:hypothetical protein
MSDESSEHSDVWWTPPGQLDPAEHEDLIEQGRQGPPHPIGATSLHSSRRPYVLAGVALAALLGGGAAGLAATHSGTPPAATSSAVVATPAPVPAAQGPGGHGGFRHFGPPPRILHGQFTVAKPGGGTQIVDFQSGDVTAVSNASITLKSSDGFTHSYAVVTSTVVDAQRDGIGSVKVGNEASLLATVSAGVATATSIQDLTLLQQGRSSFGYAAPEAGGGGSTQSG